jgi:hypothetical protein
MVVTLGGNVGDPGVPTTYVEDVDGRAPRGPTSVYGPKVCCDLHRQFR